MGYESLLERDRVWLADFDPHVTAIASQPFWLRGFEARWSESTCRITCWPSATGFVVVDVKPVRLLSRPEVAVVLDWTGRLVAAKGWRYEIWSGSDPVLLSNVRFLAGARHLDYVDERLIRQLADPSRPGGTLCDAEARVPGAARPHVRAALTLLWHHVWETSIASDLRERTPGEPIDLVPSTW